jgi:hypothetical protein
VRFELLLFSFPSADHQMGGFNPVVLAHPAWPMAVGQAEDLGRGRYDASMSVVIASG